MVVPKLADATKPLVKRLIAAGKPITARAIVVVSRLIDSLGVDKMVLKILNASSRGLVFFDPLLVRLRGGRYTPVVSIRSPGQIILNCQ